MHMEGVELVGWIHSGACMVALVFGAWNIFAPKGTGPHMARGRVYVLSMVIASLTAFGIFHFDIDPATGKAGAGIFGVFHWLAVATLVLTLLGYYASLHQARALWAYLHPICMILSYYILFGGLINELFARLDVLRPFAVTMVNGHREFGSRIVGMTQSAAMLAALLLIIVFAVKVWLYRRSASPSRSRMS